VDGQPDDRRAVGERLRQAALGATSIERRPRLGPTEGKPSVLPDTDGRIARFDRDLARGPPNEAMHAAIAPERELDVDVEWVVPESPPRAFDPTEPLRTFHRFVDGPADRGTAAEVSRRRREALALDEDDDLPVEIQPSPSPHRRDGFAPRHLRDVHAAHRGAGKDAAGVRLLVAVGGVGRSAQGEDEHAGCKSDDQRPSRAAYAYLVTSSGHGAINDRIRNHVRGKDDTSGRNPLPERSRRLGRNRHSHAQGECAGAPRSGCGERDEGTTL